MTELIRIIMEKLRTSYNQRGKREERERERERMRDGYIMK
jgi:hypothetical protein